MSESERKRQAYSTEITNINKKLKENEKKLAEKKGERGQESTRTKLEEERISLNQDYETTARHFAKHAHESSGAAHNMYYDTMYPYLQLSQRILNAANGYSLPSPQTEIPEAEQKVREEQKHQEGEEKLKRADENVERAWNKQDGHGSITHAERERQEQANNANGDGSISDAWRGMQEQVNNANGDGSISDARLAVEKETNKGEKVGPIPNEDDMGYTPTRLRRVSGRRGIGSFVLKTEPTLRDVFESDLANLGHQPQPQPQLTSHHLASPTHRSHFLPSFLPSFFSFAASTKPAAPAARDAVDDALYPTEKKKTSPSLKAQPDDGPIYDGMGGRRKTRRGRQVRRSKAKRTRREKRVRKSRKVIKRKAHKLRRH